ncbi:MAG: phosphatidate cytidylyltransferase [Peptococcaceae bacterium]|nr:phosphatidate cytidylyltransferase [Peptococcaceae bacterium]
MRVLTALVGLPLFLLVVWWGDLPLLVLLAVLIILAQKELALLFKEVNPHQGLALVSGLVLVAASYLVPDRYPAGVIILLLLFYLGLLVIWYPRFEPRALAGTLLLALYPGLFVYLYLLRELPGNWEWVLLIVLMTWAFDTLGYFAGVYLGRRRMFPTLSPKKTVEGFTGGIIASTLTGLIYGLITNLQSPYLLAAMGLLIGLAAQLGDLVASSFKRFSRVKDAGQLLPGHGGIMDRFDSLLFTAPVGYYLLRFLGNF